MYPRQRRRALTVIAVSSVLASVLVGCSSTSGAPSSGPIKIGMSLPLSGAVADVSKSGYNGYKEWADEVNASGGLLGRQIKLDVLDDGFDTNADVANYNRLISQDKVDLLLGTFSSLLNAPASAVAARQHMLYIEPSGGDPALFTRGFTNLFFAQPAAGNHLPDQFVAYIKSLPAGSRPKTAAYLQQDDPSVAAAMAIFQKDFEKLGIKTVYNQTYPPSLSAFDPIAASVVAAKPQMIIQGAVTGDGVQFVRSLQKLSYSPKILFQTQSPSDDSYPAAVGKANTEGIFTAVGWSPKSAYPGNASFVKAYTKRFGSPPTEDAANSYTAGQVLAEAVKEVGSLNQAKLISWLHTHTVQTIVGPLKWDKSGVPEGSLLLSQWQGGALQIVAPKSAATSNHVIATKPKWQG
jgi:branched-chain amino acid transport system substrate-binding protein